MVESGTDIPQPTTRTESSPNARPTVVGPDPSLSTADDSPSLGTSPPHPDSSYGLDVSLSADSRPGLDASSSIADGHPHLDASPSMADSHPIVDASLSTADSHPHLDASSSMADTRPGVDASPSTADNHPHLDASPSIAESHGGLDASSLTADSHPLSTAGNHPGLDASPTTDNRCGLDASNTPAVPDGPAALQPHQSAPLTDLNLNTYASRNPSKPVIEPKHVHKKPKVDKMTKMLKQEAREQAHKALMEAVKQCIGRREKEVTELAEAHDKTEQYIQRLVNDETHYHQKREVNLYNAKIHWKSRELNEGEYFVISLKIS